MNIPKLKGLMAEKGITQKALAEKIGVSKNTISSRLKGKSKFNTEEIKHICSVLEIIDNEFKNDIFLS